MVASLDARTVKGTCFTCGSETRRTESPSSPRPQIPYHLLLSGSALPDGGDGFEAGVHSECSEQMTDVVLDCLYAQVELLRDLLRRAPLLEQAQHFGLARSQVPGRLARVLGGLARQEPEDADHLLASDQRHRAHLQRQAGSVGRDE